MSKKRKKGTIKPIETIRQGMGLYPEHKPVQKYEPPKGVVPSGKKSGIAQDSCFNGSYGAYGDLQFYSSFLGYPYLSTLAQSSDYRMVAVTTAHEMTRAWIEVIGADDNKLQLINEALDKFQVRDMFRKHIQNEQIFGLSHLYIDVDASDDSLPLIPENVQKGKFKGLRLIEAIHTTPSAYNANNPLTDDFYQVKHWFCLGQEVHADRLLTLVMNPVPDMFKPAYNFGGLSTMQLMKPYVERWQRTVDSVSDLVKAFSITCLKTDMANILTGGDDGISELRTRLQMFGEIRDNMNLFALNTENEELVQINTPLSGLDALVTKAQEQMAMPSHTPLVKLTGITPSGLNASSEGEIQVYYDWIMGLCEAHLAPQIERVLQVIQQHLFGEIDPSITFKFNPLEQMSDKEKSEIEANKSTAATNFVTAGVFSQEEIRQALANDENLDYGFINVDDVPMTNTLDGIEE